MSVSQYQYFLCVFKSSLFISCVFTFLRFSISHSPSVPLNTLPLIVTLWSGSINTGESPIINCSPSLRIPYCVLRKSLGGLATVPKFSSSSSVTSSSLANPCLGISYIISFVVEGIGEGELCRGYYASSLGKINCLRSSGMGEGTALSGITRLRKSKIAFVRVFRLISASRNVWRILINSSYGFFF